MANQFLNSLNIQNLKDEELGIFCGAGISRDSGIPIVKPFLDYILTQFGLSKDEKHILLNDEQPFEKVVETFLRINEENGKKLLFNSFDNDYLQLTPNTAHYWITKLALDGKLNFICTTNFDTLLESALKEKKVAYHIFCKDADEFQKDSNMLCDCSNGCCKPLQEIDWNNQTLKVIKIHGCIKTRDAMAITIKKIASQKSLEIRSKVIEELFSNKGLHSKILIMGYSSSDIFDIVPVFTSLRKIEKNIYYLNHGQIEKYSELKKIKSVRDLKEAFNPFRKIVGTHFWLNANTNILFNKSISKHTFINQSWKKCIDDYIITFKAGQIDFLTALLFRRSNYFEKVKSNNGLKIALKYYKRAELKFKSSKNNLGLGSCYNNAGVILKNMGNLPAALKKYQQASNLFKKDGELLNAGKSIGNEANIYRHLGELQKAMGLHKDSLKLFKQVPSPENISICYGDIAVNYTDLKEYKKAILYHNKEMKLCTQLGDIEGLAECYLNLSKVFRILGKTKKALILCNKAEKIFKETKNNQQMSTCYINKAIIYNSKGKYGLANKLHGKGQKISMQFNDKYNLVISYSNQSQTFKELNKPKESKQLMNKSLLLVKKIGYKHLENELLALFGVKQNN
jgi:tetratricopeptide (TPR) repeat protein/NAD-dependent SIR2 family protein deacetylase